MARGVPKKTEEGTAFLGKISELLQVKPFHLKEVVGDNVAHTRALQMRWRRIRLFDYTCPVTKAVIPASTIDSDDLPEVQCLFRQRDVCVEHDRLVASVCLEAETARDQGNLELLTELGAKMTARQQRREKALVELSRIAATISSQMRADGKRLQDQILAAAKFIRAIELHPRSSALEAIPDVAGLMRLAGDADATDPA